MVVFGNQRVRGDVCGRDKTFETVLLDFVSVRVFSEAVGEA